MTDAGTRQRLALMRMVQQQQQRPPPAEGDAADRTHKSWVSVRRARNEPEIGQKLRLATEKKDVDQLKELMVRVGCANELRGRAWPLLCGVVPANAGEAYVRSLLQQQYEDYLQCSQVVGYSLSDTGTNPAVPVEKRPTLLSQEQCAAAKAAGNCYYCGSTGHYLRECPQYYLADQAKQDTVILTLLMDQYVAADFGVWDVDQTVLHWYRALCFRLSEAVPEGALAWLVVKRMISVTESKYSQTYATCVHERADRFVVTLMDGLDKASFSHNLELGADEVKRRMQALFRPMFGSLMALTSHDTFAPNDVVLRVWDALLWQPDPLLSLAHLLAGDVVTAVKLKQKTNGGACMWDHVVQAVHALVAEFDTWSDEQQRSAIGRAIEMTPNMDGRTGRDGGGTRGARAQGKTKPTGDGRATTTPRLNNAASSSAEVVSDWRRMARGSTTTGKKASAKSTAARPALKTRMAARGMAVGGGLIPAQQVYVVRTSTPVKEPTKAAWQHSPLVPPQLRFERISTSPPVVSRAPAARDAQMVFNSTGTPRRTRHGATSFRRSASATGTAAAAAARSAAEDVSPNRSADNTLVRSHTGQFRDRSPFGGRARDVSPLRTGNTAFSRTRSGSSAVGLAPKPAGARFARNATGPGRSVSAQMPARRLYNSTNTKDEGGAATAARSVNAALTLASYYPAVHSLEGSGAPAKEKRTTPRRVQLRSESAQVPARFLSSTAEKALREMPLGVTHPLPSLRTTNTRVTVSPRVSTRNADVLAATAPPAAAAPPAADVPAVGEHRAVANSPPRLRGRRGSRHASPDPRSVMSMDASDVFRVGVPTTHAHRRRVERTPPAATPPTAAHEMHTDTEPTQPPPPTPLASLEAAAPDTTPEANVVDVLRSPSPPPRPQAPAFDTPPCTSPQSSAPSHDHSSGDEKPEAPAATPCRTAPYGAASMERTAPRVDRNNSEACGTAPDLPLPDHCAPYAATPVAPTMPSTDTVPLEAHATSPAMSDSTHAAQEVLRSLRMRSWRDSAPAQGTAPPALTGVPAADAATPATPAGSSSDAVTGGASPLCDSPEVSASPPSRARAYTSPPRPSRAAATPVDDVPCTEDTAEGPSMPASPSPPGSARSPSSRRSNSSHKRRAATPRAALSPPQAVRSPGGESLASDVDAPGGRSSSFKRAPSAPKGTAGGERRSGLQRSRSANVMTRRQLEQHWGTTTHVPPPPQQRYDMSDRPWRSKPVGVVKRPPTDLFIKRMDGKVSPNPQAPIKDALRCPRKHIMLPHTPAVVDDVMLVGGGDACSVCGSARVVSACMECFDRYFLCKPCQKDRRKAITNPQPKQRGSSFRKNNTPQVAPQSTPQAVPLVAQSAPGPRQQREEPEEGGGLGFMLATKKSRLGAFLTGLVVPSPPPDAGDEDGAGSEGRLGGQGADAECSSERSEVISLCYSNDFS